MSNPDFGSWISKEQKELALKVLEALKAHGGDFMQSRISRADFSISTESSSLNGLPQSFTILIEIKGEMKTEQDIENENAIEAQSARNRTTP